MTDEDREVIVRAQPLDAIELSGSDGRTIIARMMRYDVVNNVTDDGQRWYGEVWRKGVFAQSIKRAESTKRPFPLMTNHDLQRLPVGATSAIHERDDGPWFTGRISKTQAGDELLELVNDGAMPGISVRAPVYRSRKTAEGVTERLECGITEISFTPWAQLDGGEVMAVRATIPGSGQSIREFIAQQTAEMERLLGR